MGIVWKEAGVVENTNVKNKYIGRGYKGDNGKEGIEGINDMAKSQKGKGMQPRAQVKNLEGDALLWERGKLEGGHGYIWK